MRNEISDAIEAIYAAAARPVSWPMALQSLADCFGDVGGLLIYTRDDGRFGTIVSPSLAECEKAYQGGWWKQDIRTFRALEYGYRANAGAITDRHGISDHEIATHPIYTQFLAPFGLRWTASVQVSPQSGVHVGLSIQRSSAKPPFSDDELALLTALGRHAEQALRLSLRLIDAELVSLGLGEALSRLAIGAFVVDEAARVIFANQKAKGLLSGPFVLKGGILACRAPAHQKRFSAMLRASGAQVAFSAQDRPSEQPPLLIERDGQGDKLALYAMPLQASAEDSSDLMREGRAIVLAIDLMPGAPIDPSLVRDVYGLTLGEARVASLVGTGISPQDAATRLNIAEGTVRSALKRVFAKLGVSRQAEMTALLSQLKMADHRAGAQGPT